MEVKTSHEIVVHNELEGNGKRVLNQIVTVKLEGGASS